MSVGNSYSIEVWVQDVLSPGLGIMGGYVDVGYTTTRTDALTLTHSGIFTMLLDGRIDDTAGLLDDIGGGTFTAGVGIEPNWVRLGSIDYTVTDTGPITLTLSPGRLAFSRFGAGNVPWEHVSLGDLTLNAPTSARIVGRHIFYNDSTFDENDPTADVADHSTIATDKSPLRPGDPQATFANYTSYIRGINGIIVDIAGAVGALTVDDFVFKVGNDNDPDNWNEIAVENMPSVEVRAGQGVGGSDRVTIIFDDNVVKNEWLQVTMLANNYTGLAEDDVFYFGNAIGESGNSTIDAKVNAIDVLLARNNPRNLLNPATLDSRYDFNRDQRVNATDMLIARDNQTHLLDALKLIAVPEDSDAKNAGLDTTSPEARLDTDEGNQSEDSTSPKLDWMFEFEQRQYRPDKRDQVEEAVDELLQMWPS